MIVYLNGQFMAEDEAKVSVFDRGFLYGDSLFETIPLLNGRLFRWHQHLERMQRGLDFLRIKPAETPAQLRDAARSLVERNQLREGRLRLTVSRGTGTLGYSPAGTTTPTTVMFVRPGPAPDPDQPARCRLHTSTYRIAPGDRTASHKTGSKIMQVMALAEAEAAGADEALLVNTNGEVAEASSANLFWIRGEVLYTSPTAVGILPGITRAVVLEICATQQIPIKKRLARADMLPGCDALFLTHSGQGVVEVESLDGLPFGGSPLVEQLRRAYIDVQRRECGVAAGAPKAG